ncbi:MAG: SH3 domain-containing protein [Lachnospiraceae bacterium]|jgi:cell wall-associated NlpC family hydrolase|nr:SH3 domain-containing protein [Lachnospiraceae bacterium]
MKRGVLQFTACCLAAGMTFTGMTTVAFAAKDVTLAGFSGIPTVTVENRVAQPQTESTETAAAQTETFETEAFQTESVQTEPPVAETAAESQTDVSYDAPAQTEVQTEAPETEPVVDTSMSGEIAFAQCEEYINVRSSASADSEVVGKVYNNGSVTILSQVGDWYEVQSGNATGYVKAEFFVIGEHAQSIADEVAYNVATVHPEALVVRSQPSEDSEQIGMAYSSDQLEVVQYEGDWMKVALGGDVYGYVNAYYVDYDTYYPTAETLEEEQARLDQEWLNYLADQEAERAAAEQAYLDAIAEQEAAEQQAAWDAEWQAQQSSQTSQDAQASADAAYQEYLDAQAEADAATQQADEQAVIDAANEAQAAYQAYLEQQAAADAAAQEEQQQTEPVYTEPEQPSQPDYTEPDYSEPDYSEPDYSEPEPPSSGYTLGQQIVDFAVQYVGCPYVWGGTSLTNGADCSGFTQSVMANFGIYIPRVAADQAYGGTPVSLSEIQAGDLLFYEGGGGIGHVTIYMGNGQVVHASTSDTGIIISDYSYRTPVSARRYW